MSSFLSFLKSNAENPSGQSQLTTQEGSKRKSAGKFIGKGDK